MKNKVIKRLLICCLFLSVGVIIHAQKSLPEKIYMNTDSTAKVNYSIPFSLTEKSTQTNSDMSSVQALVSHNEGDYNFVYKIFGIIPIKEVSVTVTDEMYVTPLGVPIGMYLHTEGVMIIGTETNTDEFGKTYNPAENLVEAGDYICAFNNIKVSSKSHLIYLINKNGNKSAQLSIKNDAGERKIAIEPIKDSEGEYKLGIWVRDDTQGLGTVTYVTEDNHFGALGHGVTDIDTGKILESNQGSVYEAKIWSIKKGQEGAPGSICGSIEYEDENIMGVITTNCNVGIYGTLFDETQLVDDNLKKVPICSKQDIKEGPAKIIFTIEGETKEFDVEIIKIDYSDSREDKNLVLEITDNELIEKTGGIVQGMSGSPIIQDGKIIGAVTHVLVDDPTRGYGIFIENMLGH